MKRLKNILGATLLVLGVGTVLLAPAYAGETANALDPISGISDGVKGAGGGGANTQPLKNKLKQVVNILLFVLGAIAVIVIVIGGIRYATSGGDSGQISAAKNTILYAVVGLVVAILAYAIVNFVLGAFIKVS